MNQGIKELNVQRWGLELRVVYDTQIKKMVLRVIFVKQPFKISVTFNCLHVFLIELISAKHHSVWLLVHTKRQAGCNEAGSACEFGSRECPVCSPAHQSSNRPSLPLPNSRHGVMKEKYCFVYLWALADQKIISTPPNNNNNKHPCKRAPLQRSKETAKGMLCLPE